MSYSSPWEAGGGKRSARVGHPSSVSASTENPAFRQDVPTLRLAYVTGDDRDRLAGSLRFLAKLHELPVAVENALDFLPISLAIELDLSTSPVEAFRPSVSRIPMAPAVAQNHQLSRPTTTSFAWPA